MAKVRLLEKEVLKPGETTWAQLSLSEPVALVKGDHFIIRSPMETLGGGKVVEPHTKRYRRFRPATIQSLEVKEQGTSEEIVMAILGEKPLELPAILAKCGLPADEAQPVIESLVQQGEVVKIGQGEHRRLMTTNGWKRLAEKAAAIVQDYHQRFPARSGMPRAELSSRLQLGTYSSAILQRLLDEGTIAEAGAAVRRPAHQARLTQAQQAKVNSFLQSLAKKPFAPPGDLALEPDLLNLLVEQRQVVKASDDVVFSASAYSEMVKRVTSHLKTNGRVTLAEVRDMFDTSRKYALALLEHLDRAKITRRVGDERVLYQQV
jgi:selenocysteine-specific elongation factor